jgi:hypothetical protein
MLNLILITLLRVNVPVVDVPVVNVPEVNVPAMVSGDYVEARTASVFAGPCHYNGEVVTTGRDAVMAWSIERGIWKGVDLSHVTVAAAVSSEANLAEATSPHRCELQIDPSASDTQVAAVVDWLKFNCGASIGMISSIRRGPVTFTKDGEHTVFAATGFASADVQSMPNHECCKQPSLVWYKPLSPLPHRMVGYTVDAKYSAGTIGDQWDRSDENSAFYGHF